MPDRLLLPLTIPADHPAFPGHFPRRPILPGAALLDLAIMALCRALGHAPGALLLVSAKFLAPVGPGSTLRMQAEQTAGGRWRCTLSDAGGAKVAQCELHLGVGDLGGGA